MASKRTSQGNDERDLQVPSKQRRHGNPEKQVAETRHHLSFLTAATSHRATNDIALYLEPVLRKVLQEVIPPMLQRHLTPSGTSRGRRLQLCFVNKLPEAIFTQSNIRAEGGEPLRFELRDAAHQQRIVMDEGSSSLKIRICVLDGEFGSTGEEDWTAQEFNAKIVNPTKGKGQLLNRNTVITLKDGVGYINKKIVFTDISRTRSKTFRLGLQIVQSNYSSTGAADIREGRSEPFRVKDHRGEPYEKHDPPLLNDEVWRLRGIRKVGKLHEQLTNHGIKTVKDLLQLYTTNQASLREKIGKTAGKSWSKIIAHAKDCRVDDDDDKRCFYYATEQSILIFNCIYEVVEVTFDGQNYHSIKSLNPEEKQLVERVKKQAYNNLEDLMPLDTTTAHGLVETLTGVQTAQYGAPDQVMQQLDIPFAQQGQPETWPSNSSILGEMLPCCSAGEPLISGAWTDDRVPQIDPSASYLLSPNYQWEQVNFNPFSFGYADGAECSNPSFLPNSTVYISRKGKRKTVWHKIRTAFKFILHSHCTRS